MSGMSGPPSSTSGAPEDPPPAPPAGASAPADVPAAPAVPSAGGAAEAAASAAPGAALDPGVADVLQRLRSGVRQRQAEAATMAGGLAAAESAGMAQALLAVRSHEYVQEPVAFSHRPGLGRLVVFSRKGFFHLFLKWFVRPVLAQQNAFNQAVGRVLQELAEGQERSAREARLLAARVGELEARTEAAAAAAASGAARAAAEPAGPPAAPAALGAAGPAEAASGPPVTPAAGEGRAPR
jgi:hypothetical protein